MSTLLAIERATVHRGRRPVLRDVSISVDEGEIVGLLGPNGAGKSTLLRAALGLAPLASGSVRLGALDPATADRRAIAKAAALLPEHAEHGSGLTVREVVRTGRYAHVGPLEAERASDRAAVDEAIAALGLAPLAERRLDALSAGERKRVILARCFAQAAPLFLLDEPTSTLDLGHARALFASLRARIVRGGGALVAMHDLSLAAASCDRVVALHEGEVLAMGRPDEVLRAEIVEKLFGARAHVETTEGEIVLRIPR
ncbi:MAG: ABC transporter ATP-binding protein [Sandaracinus sp.]